MKKARRHARLVAAKIENRERQVLKLSPEDSRLFVSCTRKLKPFNVTLESAINEFVAAREIVGAIRFWQAHRSDSIPDKLLSEIIEEFLAVQKRDGVSAEYLGELTRFLNHVADRFQTNIMSITPAMLKSFFTQSYRLAATQSPNQTALKAGHDVKILFRHYRELVTKASKRQRESAGNKGLGFQNKQTFVAPRRDRTDTSLWRSTE